MFIYYNNLTTQFYLSTIAKFSIRSENTLEQLKLVTGISKNPSIIITLLLLQIPENA